MLERRYSLEEAEDEGVELHRALCEAVLAVESQHQVMEGLGGRSCGNYL